MRAVILSERGLLSKAVIVRELGPSKKAVILSARGPKRFLKLGGGKRRICFSWHPKIDRT